MIAYLECLSRPEDGVDPVLVEVGLAAVHEVQQDLEVVGPGPVQHHEELQKPRQVTMLKVLN